MTDLSKFHPDSLEPQFNVIGICGSCIWQRKNPFKCRAFPDGIPKEILFGDFIHTRRHPAQTNDVTFSRRGPQGIS